MKKMLFGNGVILAFCFYPFTSPAADAVSWNGLAGDADWCKSLNWNLRKVPVSGDTAIFREYDSEKTNIVLTCNTAVARVKLSGNAVSPRIIRIGPDETSDRTLTINGTAEALVNENIGIGRDLTFSGEPNGFNARLKMRINSSTDPWGVWTTTSSIIVNCDVFGPGGVYKTDVGTVVLAGNNSFGAPNVITAGRVIIRHGNALGVGGFNAGAGKPGTEVMNLATLELAGTTNVNEVITLNGVGLGFLGGAMINSSNTVASIAGDMLTSISVSDGGSGYSSPVSVIIAGGGGSGATATAELGLSHDSFTLTSGGVGYTTPPTVYLFGGGGSGAQIQAVIDTNTTEVVDLVVASPGSGYSSAPLVVIAGDGVEAEAVANANNFAIVGTTLETPGSGYTSAPSVSFSGGGTAAATANLAEVIIGSIGATIGGSGPITINPQVTGTGLLTKKGANVLTLNGANTYSGGTAINEGLLLANNAGGSATGSGGVTVNAGGALGGNGAVGGLVTVNGGGNLSGGSSVGILTCAGGLNLSGGGTNVWELVMYKDNNDGVAGVDFDQVAVKGGELDLSGNSQLRLRFTGATAAPYSTNGFWQTNHSWTIVPVSGSGGNGTNLPFANIVNGIYNAGSFSNYVGAGGSVVLTYTANAPSAPQILVQPQSVGTNWGKSVRFEVTALGTDPLSYQWYFQEGGGLIAGATGTSYTVASVDWTNVGNYYVVITNALGSTNSDLAGLTILVPPPAEIQPVEGAGTIEVYVSWGTQPGAAYRLEYNTDLSTTNWVVVSNLVATGTSVTVKHRRLKIDAQRYYRVIAQ